MLHTHFATNIYFFAALQIANAPNSATDQREKFPAGEHRLPFAFQIPKDTPSSFQTAAGKVRYQVKAVADRPWHMDNSSTAVFSVNHLYDLSSDSNARVIFFVCVCMCLSLSLSLYLLLRNVCVKD